MSPVETSGPRRSPTKDSQGRRDLLDAAERVLLDEGYAAVTARRVAAEAGKAPQLVHYYFITMDELFGQLVRRGLARSERRLARALEDAQPLHALWRLSMDPVGTALATEYLALARNRKEIAEEVAQAGTRFRLAQHAAFLEAISRYDLETGDLAPAAVLVALEGMARLIVQERSVGSSTFHDEALDAVGALLTRLEGPPRT